MEWLILLLHELHPSERELVRGERCVRNEERTNYLECIYRHAHTDTETQRQRRSWKAT